MAYGVEWKDFVLKFDEDNPYGIQAINNIYVYVDNISDVEKQQELLMALTIIQTIPLKRLIISMHLSKIQ